MEKSREMESSIEKTAFSAKQKSFALGASSIDERNGVLLRLAALLRENQDQIFQENKKDLKRSQEEGLSSVMLKRLELTPAKIAQMAKSVEEVAALADPLGVVQIHRQLDQDLILKRYSVPVGLIGVIFEARPESLIQIASLCLKSGNCAILKGGKEAVNSNQILYQLILQASIQSDQELGKSLFEGTVVLVETRDQINQLLKLDHLIDLMIPRGSNALVQFVKEHTKIPVLGHADGICHYYVDEEVDLEEALLLVADSKTQNPAVCNAIETLLVHQAIAPTFLPLLQKKFSDPQMPVSLLGDERASTLLSIPLASEEDWATEYDDFILSIKIVDSIDEAVDHINRYGSHHTDAIATTNEKKAAYFISRVNSSSVMHNASTRFADGFRYGFGAEVGISTAKIHARGPVGLEGLTLYQYCLQGKGHCVKDYVDGNKMFHHKDLP